MKRVLVTMMLLMTGVTFAGGDYDDDSHDNGPPVVNKSNSRATGIGVGVGIGKGGDGGDARSMSRSHAEGGSAKSKSHAEGGDSDQQQKQGQKQHTNVKQGQKQANKQRQNADNDVSVSYYEEGDDYPVSTAWAPPTQVTAPCMVGVSAGAQAERLGISLGGHYMDEECVLNRTYVLFATNPFTKDNAALLHGIACQMNAYRTASASLNGFECPQYENEREEALRPLEGQRFRALSKVEAQRVARKCHIADEGCF